MAKGAYRNRWRNSLGIDSKWLIDFAIADITLDNVIEAIKHHWGVRADTVESMASKLSPVFAYVTRRAARMAEKEGFEPSIRY
jgi:hypothetical protein